MMTTIDNLILAPYDRCNLRCRMCRSWQNRTQEAMPDLSAYEIFVDELRPFFSQDFKAGVVGGGEPLLYDKLIALIASLRKRGIFTHLITNGTLMTEDLAIRIIGSEVNMIGFSIDSHIAELHERQRGVAGCFEKSVNGLTSIKRHSSEVTVTVLALLSDITFATAAELIDVAIDYWKVDFIQFNVVNHPFNHPDTGDWRDDAQFSDLWPRDPEIIETVFERLKEKKQDYPVQLVNSRQQLESFKRYFLDPETYVKQGPCNLHRNIYVRQSGHISFCGRQEQAGNIARIGSDFSIVDFLQSHEYQKLRRKISQCKRNCHQLINCFFDE